MEDNEKTDLTKQERSDLRFQLYGGSEGCNYGKCKIECQSDQMVIISAKCYFLTSAGDDGEDVVDSVKFKGISGASKLSAATLHSVGRREVLLKERGVRIGRSSFGVRRKGCSRMTCLTRFFVADRSPLHRKDSRRLPVGGCKAVLLRRRSQRAPPFQKWNRRCRGHGSRSDTCWETERQC